MFSHKTPPKPLEKPTLPSWFAKNPSQQPPKDDEKGPHFTTRRRKSLENA